MTFGRRLRLFILGLGLGTLLSFAIFGKSCTNTAWAPDARVRLRMKSTLVRATPQAEEALKTLQLDLAALRAGMDSFDVDFSHSRRTDDSLYYELNGAVQGRAVQLNIATLRDYEVDSTSTLLMVRPR
jgi:hypothetical protein